MKMVFLPFLAFVLPSGGVEAWLDANFSRNVLPPFSFVYDGRHSSEFLRDWKFTKEKIREDGTKKEFVFTYSSPEKGLVVRCEAVVFKDFPAIEWVLKFRNDGKTDTPIIENIKALDYLFRGEGEFVLHRALGSNAQRDDFAPVEEWLKQGNEIKIVPLGGRSSNTTSLPFFNLEDKGKGGVIISIGWSGQWLAEFEKKEEGVQVSAGMELVHLKLHPGEEIRTPRISLLFWEGEDYLSSQNLFRKFLIASSYPQNKRKTGYFALLLQFLRTA
jgi:alpha-galactosidase